MIEKCRTSSNIITLSRFLTMLLFCCLTFTNTHAKLDTFRLLTYNRNTKVEVEVSKLYIEVKNNRYSIERLGENLFVHPLTLLNKDDSIFVLVIEFQSQIFRLEFESVAIQSSVWEISLPFRKRYNRRRKYDFILYYYGGNWGVMSKFQCLSKAKGSKMILSNEYLR